MQANKNYQKREDHNNYLILDELFKYSADLPAL
jgi:hypothetical protein